MEVHLIDKSRSENETGMGIPTCVHLISIRGSILFCVLCGKTLFFGAVNSTAPHRIPAVQALVARAAANGDAAAHIARGGIGL